MAKIRIYELSKKIGVPNKTIIAELSKLGVKAKTHSSSVEAEIAKKIEVELDNTLKRVDKVDPTRVKLITKRGEVYSKHVEDPLGSLQRPMSFNDCAKKFRDCAKKLPERKIGRLLELIAQLEQVTDIREIIDLLSIE